MQEWTERHNASSRHALSVAQLVELHPALGRISGAVLEDRYNSINAQFPNAPIDSKWQSRMPDLLLRNKKQIIEVSLVLSGYNYSNSEKMQYPEIFVDGTAAFKERVAYLRQQFKVGMTDIRESLMLRCLLSIEVHELERRRSHLERTYGISNEQIRGSWALLRGPADSFVEVRAASYKKLLELGLTPEQIRENARLLLYDAKTLDLYNSLVVKVVGNGNVAADPTLLFRPNDPSINRHELLSGMRALGIDDAEAGKLLERHSNLLVLRREEVKGLVRKISEGVDSRPIGRQLSINGFSELGAVVASVIRKEMASKARVGAN